jgi:hypothetical protein
MKRTVGWIPFIVLLIGCNETAPSPAKPDLSVLSITQKSWNDRTPEMIKVDIEITNRGEETISDALVTCVIKTQEGQVLGAQSFDVVDSPLPPGERIEKHIDIKVDGYGETLTVPKINLAVESLKLARE